MGLIYNYVFAREPGPLGFLARKNHSDEYYEWRDSAKLHLEQSPHTEYTITDSKGNTLFGYYYPAGDKPSKKIAFVVHGFRSCSSETAGVLKGLYHSRGIDLFTVDNPASGKSEGDFISYDYYEGEAVLKWIDFLNDQYGDDIEILLHGFSLGGATVLSVSDRVPQNVRFIIDDCGFTSGEDILKKNAGFMSTFLNFLSLVKNNLRFSLGKTNVRPHLVNAKCPILFFHGEIDESVPFTMGKELFSLCPTYKDYMWVKHAGHMECYYCERRKYAEKIDEFLSFFM